MEKKPLYVVIKFKYVGGSIGYEPYLNGVFDNRKQALELQERLEWDKDDFVRIMDFRIFLNEEIFDYDEDSNGNMLCWSGQQI